MRRFAAVLIAVLNSAAVYVQAPDIKPIPQISLNDAVADPQKRSALLDELYKRLKASPSDDDAKRVQTVIDALLSETGSRTSDLFMKWAEESLQKGDGSQALDYLDGAVIIAPNAPEPYHRRAAIHYAQQDYTKALSDLEHAYMLEPRHTGVLLGLGTLFADLNREKEALRAYDRALELNPRLEDARRVADELRKRVEGEAI